VISESLNAVSVLFAADFVLSFVFSPAATVLSFGDEVSWAAAEPAVTAMTPTPQITTKSRFHML
jgi:plastocyanin